MSASPEAADGHHTNYVKIWAILLVLLVISVLGPLLGHRTLTLVTAFGIAGVKAYIVAAHFMHLKTELKIASYILVTMVALMVLLFMGVSPDVMKHDGRNWNNDAAKAETHRAESAHSAAGAEH